MSKPVGKTLPDDIRAAFDGNDLTDKIGPAYLLITTDEDGTPRPCMLSAGEIYVPDERTIRMALWPGTKTSANLERRGRVLFCYVAPRTVFYLRGVSRSLWPGSESKLARFEIAVDSVESDVHEGMPVRETIVFDVERLDHAELAARWKQQIDALREP